MSKNILTGPAIFLILILAAHWTAARGQSRKERDSLNIRAIEHYDVDYEDSNGKEYLVKMEKFDDRGELTEEIEYDDHGRIDKHTRYVYEGNLLVREISLDRDGKVKRTIEYEYDGDGLKTAKRYYDEKDRIYKEKRYRYRKE